MAVQSISVKTILLLPIFFFYAQRMSAQSSIAYTFDSDTSDCHIKKGSIELSEQGAHKGKALKLLPNTSIVFTIKLQPASIYKITAWMRTESGADAFSVQITGLGKNNISATTALATWTRIERSFNVSAGQQTGELEFIFGNTQGNTAAWVDEITIERTGDYKEVVCTGIPPAAPRQVKTELGISMQPNEKMQWMQDAKLGMFIHWGLYAGPAQGEWYMQNRGIAMDEYRKLAYPESGDVYFDAKDFDARKWAALAKRTGMKYMNMVTQHHDGYALFESKYMNAFTSKQTHNRDFVKEYVEACREAGLKVGLYKTLINWRFPGYYDIYGNNCQPNKFGYKTAAWHKENARLMKEELYCQVKELMTNYGKIDQLFWDGGWLGQKGSDADGAHFWESGKSLSDTSQWPVNPYFQDIDSAKGKPLGLMGMVRKYQPDILVNPRSGWTGDYNCEEGGGAVKGSIRSDVVEKCMTLAPGWGYSKMMEDSSRITSLKNIKRILADCMVRNMNFLINIGPDRHGNVPPLIEQRLNEFGEWVHHTEEAIYGTRGGPWEPVDGQFGFCYKDNIIYIYFLGDYTAGTFTLPPVNTGMRITKAYNVYTREKIDAKQKGQTITLKGIRPLQNDITVIAVALNKSVR
ncbi:MAG: alpha-L-fucosidase [Breznakibacter sp.]